jgi:hypothetical protein
MTDEERRMQQIQSDLDYQTLMMMQQQVEREQRYGRPPFQQTNRGWWDLPCDGILGRFWGVTNKQVAVWGSVLVVIVFCCVVFANLPARNEQRESLDRPTFSSDPQTDPTNNLTVPDIKAESPETKAALPLEWRIWTSKNGYTGKAQFVSIDEYMDGYKVTLRKEDGSTVLVPKDKLSTDDLQWIEEHR